MGYKSYLFILPDLEFFSDQKDQIQKIPLTYRLRIKTSHPIISIPPPHAETNNKDEGINQQNAQEI